MDPVWYCQRCGHHHELSQMGKVCPNMPGLTHQQALDAQQLIQDDLQTYFDGMPDRVLLDICDIVVKRFREQCPTLYDQRSTSGGFIPGQKTATRLKGTAADPTAKPRSPNPPAWKMSPVPIPATASIPNGCDTICATCPNRP